MFPEADESVIRRRIFNIGVNGSLWINDSAPSLPLASRETSKSCLAAHTKSKRATRSRLSVPSPTSHKPPISAKRCFTFVLRAVALLQTFPLILRTLN